MSPAELARVGEALYGARWQTEMATALAVSDRSVRRWAAGDIEPPPYVARTLAEIVAGRIARLQQTERQLAKLVAKAAS